MTSFDIVRINADSARSPKIASPNTSPKLHKPGSQPAPSAKLVDSSGRQMHKDEFVGKQSDSTAQKSTPAMTPLQKHVAFFDRNNDGIITPAETYAGCRAIGCNRLVSAAAAAIINGAMGWPTSRGWLPTLNVNVKNISGAMHGSDTRLYNEQGEFDLAGFDALFDLYDKDNDGCWSVSEFAQRTRAQRSVFDLFGQTATVLEFGILYYLVGHDGRIARDDLRKVYDGTLFDELEAARARKDSAA